MGKARSQRTPVAVRTSIAQKRKQTLSSLSIQPGTRYRYLKALRALVSFWHAVGLVPSSPDTVDEALAEYIENCWAKGKPSNVCNDAASGLQWIIPRLRGKLAQSWRLLKVWAKVQPPVRCAPLTPILCLGLAGLAKIAGFHDVATCLCVGFDAFLRTGELFAMRKSHISFVKKPCYYKTAHYQGWHTPWIDGGYRGAFSGGGVFVATSTSQ